MSREFFKHPLWLLAVAMFSLGGLTQSVQAQATRTWVSGVGDDANPCSRTAPCKTFAGAIGKTATGGEINAIDPGGFSGVTITKSITIDGGGTLASILSLGSNGIIINGAATDVVHLRNLSIDGATFGINGIRILQAGTVTLQNVQIFGMSQNAVDIVSTAGTGTLNVALDNVRVQDVAGAGVSIDGSARAVNVAASDLQVIKSATGINVLTGATASVHRSKISFATTAAIASTTASSVVRLSDTTITGNTVGLSTTSGGQIISYNNTRLLGNTTDGAPTSTVYQR